MDKSEARAVMAAQLDRYRAMSYAALRELIGETDAVEAAGPSGAAYQVEIQVMWDDQPDGDLRVHAGIDDGGWRAFSPLTDDFLMAPDGTLVGEEGGRGIGRET